jgi:hypothetical protein
VPWAETPEESAEAGRESDTMEGALGRSSIFSRKGRWTPPREGTVGRSWSFGKVRPCASRERTGRELAVGAGADALVPGDDMGRQRTERFS